MNEKVPRKKRIVAMGMQSPGRGHDGGVDGMMQHAIEDLARQVNRGQPTAQGVNEARFAPRYGMEQAIVLPRPAIHPTRPISVRGQTGLNRYYARDDHTHKGQPYKAVAGVPGPADPAPDGTFCLSGKNIENQSVWVRQNGAWVCITHVEAPAVPAGPKPPSHTVSFSGWSHPRVQGLDIQTVFQEVHWEILVAFYTVCQRLGIPSPSIHHNALPGWRQDGTWDSRAPSMLVRNIALDGFPVGSTVYPKAHLAGLPKGLVMQNLRRVHLFIAGLIAGLRQVDWRRPLYSWETAEITREAELRLLKDGTGYHYFEDIEEYAASIGIDDYHYPDSCRWNYRNGKDWDDTMRLLSHLEYFEVKPRYEARDLGHYPEYWDYYENTGMNPNDTGPLYNGVHSGLDDVWPDAYEWLTRWPVYDPDRQVDPDYGGHMHTSWEAFREGEDCHDFAAQLWSAEYQGGVGFMGGFGEGYDPRFFPNTQATLNPDMKACWTWFSRTAGAWDPPPYTVYPSGVEGAYSKWEWEARWSFSDLTREVAFHFGSDTITVPGGVRGKWRDFGPAYHDVAFTPEMSVELPEEMPFDFTYYQWAEYDYVDMSTGETRHFAGWVPLWKRDGYCWGWANGGPRYIAQIETLEQAGGLS